MIYLAHFGLREPPFGITPDTSFYYACSSIQDAMNTLLVAVANGEGFIKVTGEVGTGKTLLCRKLLASLDEHWVSAYIPNPNLEPQTLLRALVEELGVKVEGPQDQHHLLKALNRTLLEYARDKKRVLLCLDETQAMPLESLETLRLLSNLETEKRKLLQVVLFGQPELDDKLKHNSIRQLRQRITFEHHLGTMTLEETEHYLVHRMQKAGYTGDAVFSPAAVRIIHRASRGVPRLINILANKSLMLVFGEGGRKVGQSQARAAIADTPSASVYGSARSWAAFSGVCVIVAAFVWVLMR